MHASGEVSAAEDHFEEGVRYDSVLNVELNHDNEDEPPVVMQAAEDVVLVVSAVCVVVLAADDATVEHVEDLHENEGVEHEGVVLGAEGGHTRTGVHLFSDHVVLDVKHGRSCKQQHYHNDEHVNRL